MLTFVEKLSRQAALGLAWFAALTLVAIMTMTFVDVIGRNFLGRSLIGTVETVSLMMGVLVFSGLAVTELNRSHIVVETFQGLFPRLLKRSSMIVNSLLAVGVAGLLLNQLFTKTVDVMAEQEFTMILKLPYWPAAILMLIGFAVFFVLLVLRLIRDVIGPQDQTNAD
ncbi:TRAP transporter small permease [Planktotalea sp.]|uniref:TRAP transporter small permease n=1 Tax=Planktotalea sp. TaxID=2029877 RepID=UPI0025E637CC|nr:TRAP transporter small permease [Planktotalea sp.]